MEIKEKAIIYSSFRQFSKYGYEKTSISDIYKEAGISKGLVYYYFKDKKELYLKSLKYAINKVSLEIDKYDFSSLDFLSRLANITIVKLEFFLNNKNLIRFIESSTKEKSLSILKEVRKVLEKNHADSIKKIEEMIDYDRIEVDIPRDKVIDIINFTFSGAYNKASLLETESERRKLVYLYKDILIKLLYEKR